VRELIELNQLKGKISGIVNPFSSISSKILENSLKLWSSFGVRPDWTYTCVAPIRRRYYASRYATEYKLNKYLGWTQKEVADLFDVTQSKISQDISNIGDSISLIISDYYDNKKTPETITEYYNIDFPLFWAIVLDGKDDLERFET